MTTNQLLRCLAPVLLWGSVAGCAALDEFWHVDFADYPEARLENLERLHARSGKHHYTVRFTGDVEHVLGHQSSTGGMHFGAPSNQRTHRPRQLADPSETCLRMLDELLDRDSSNFPRLEAAQVTWCARIIQEDPSVLSRERAVRALAVIGKRRGAREPYLLRLDAPRASAEETAVLLSEFVASWERLRAKEGSEGEWKDSMLAIQQTSFDLKGYRRVLPVVAGLLEGLRAKDPQYAALLEFTRELEVSTICFAFGDALTQKALGGSLVRGAAVKAIGEAGGAVSIARLMPYLRAEHESGQDRDPYMVSELLAHVANTGFPDAIPGLEETEYDRIRESWYALLVSIAVTDPEGRLRIKACQALAMVTGESPSLREEDWEDWLYARATAQAELNPGPGAKPFVSAPEDTPASSPPDPGDGGS